MGKKLPVSALMRELGFVLTDGFWLSAKHPPVAQDSARSWVASWGYMGDIQWSASNSPMESEWNVLTVVIDGVEYTNEGTSLFGAGML